MLEKLPTHSDIESTLGASITAVWNELNEFVVANYSFEPVWDHGGKYAIWELKYRRSGKTLCAFYVKERCLAALVVFGKAEREKFELMQADFNTEIIDIYQNTRQYHDGKWLWIDVKDMKRVEDIKKLILIKKKPNFRAR